MSAKSRLVKDLKKYKAPRDMIRKAKSGYYDDFETTIAFPITQLVKDAYSVGLNNIAEKAKNGDYDSIIGENNE